MEKFLSRVDGALNQPQISVGNWRVLISLIVGWLGAAGLVDNVIEWRDWFEIGVMEHWRRLVDFISLKVAEWTGLRVPKFIFDYTLLSVSFFRITGTYAIFSFYWFSGTGFFWSFILVPIQGFLTALCVFAWPLMLALTFYKGARLALSKSLSELSRFSKILISRTISFSIFFLLFLFVCSDILKTAGVV